MLPRIPRWIWIFFLIISTGCGFMKDQCPSFLCKKESTLSQQDLQVQQCASRYQTQWNASKKWLEALSSSCVSKETKSQLIQGVEAKLRGDFSSTRDLSELAKAYFSTQKQLAYCRLFDFSESARSLSPTNSTEEKTFDDQLLAHMVGDSFALHSGFEGLDGKESRHWEERTRMFTLMEKNAKNTYITSKEQAEPCLGMGELELQKEYGSLPVPDFPAPLLTSLKNKTQVATDIQQARVHSQTKFDQVLRQNISTLTTVEPHNRLFFQGGWSGHAIVLEITKESNHPTYQFRAYNSGGGINYHGLLFANGKMKGFPYFEKSHVSYEKITSSAFFKFLYDIDAFGSKVSERTDKTFYTVTTALLDGVLTTKEAEFDDFLNIQEAGTCAYYSIPYYHKATLQDPYIASLMEFYLKMRKIDEYFYVHRTRMLHVFPSYELFQKSLEAMGKEIAKTRKDPLKTNLLYISSGEEAFLRDRITAYQETLNKENQTRKKVVDELLSQPGKEALDQLTGKGEDKTLLSGYFLTSGPLEELPIPTHGDANAFLDGTNGIHKFLTRIEQDQYYSSNETQHLRAYITLKEWVRTLPFPVNEASPFWENFASPDQKIKAIEALTNASEMYLKLAIQLNQSNWTAAQNISFVDMLVPIKLLAITNFLKDRFQSGAPPSEEIPSLFQASFHSLLVTPSVDVFVSDAKWTEEFKKIQAYWTKHKIPNGTPTFFSWEKRGTISPPSPTNVDLLRHFFPTNAAAGMSDFVTHWSVKFGAGIYGSGAPATTKWADINWLFANLQGVGCNEAVTTPEKFLRLSLSAWKTNCPTAGNQIGVFLSLQQMSAITNYFVNGSFQQNGVPISSDSVKEELYAIHAKLETKLDAYGNKVSVWKVSQTDFTAIPFLQPSASLITEEGDVPVIKEGKSTFPLHIPSYLTKVSNDNENYIETPASKLSRSAGKLGKEPLALVLKENSNPDTETRRREGNNDDVILFPKTDAKSPMTFELFRQTLQLTGHQELQVSETLSYFRQNPGLLFSPSTRMFFERLLFEPGLLEAEFTHNPNISNLLAEFCQEEYDKYMDQKNLPMGLYFLHLNQVFSEFHLQYRIGAPSPFMNSFTHYKDLLFKEGNQKPVVRNAIFRGLIRTFLKQDRFLTPEHLSYFVIAHLYRKANPFTPEESQRHVENEIQGIHLRWIPWIYDEMAGKPLDPFLHPILAFFDFHGNLDPSSVTWRKEFGSDTYNLEEGTTKIASISLASMELQVEGFRLDRLPDDIANTLWFQENVGAYHADTVFKQWDLYGLTSKDGFSYRVKKELDRKVRIQKLWGSTWYERVPLTENASYTAGFFASSPLWMEIGHASPGTSSGPEPFAETIHGYKKALLLDPQTKKPMAVALFSHGSNELVKILKIEGDHVLSYRLHQIEFEKSPYVFLKKIEQPLHIVIWTEDKPNPALKEIELPRLGLDLYPNKEGQLYVKQFSEYTLEKEARIEEISPFQSYLTLKKDKETLVLIPAYEIQKIGGSTLGAPMLTGPLADTGSKYLVYKVNPHTGELLLRNQEERLYMGYIHFMISGYEKSRRLLSKAGSYEGYLGAMGTSLLLKLMETAESEPKAKALRNLASFLVVRDQTQRHMEEEDIFLSATRNYQDYVSILDQIGSPWLSQGDEQVYNEYLTYILEKMHDKESDANKKISIKNLLTFLAHRRQMLQNPTQDVVTETEEKKGIRYNSHLYYFSKYGLHAAQTKDAAITEPFSSLNGGGLAQYFFDFYEVCQLYISQDPSYQQKGLQLFQKLQLPIRGDRLIEEMTDYLKIMMLNTYRDEKRTDVHNQPIARFFLHLLQNGTPITVPARNVFERKVNDPRTPDYLNEFTETMTARTLELANFFDTSLVYLKNKERKIPDGQNKKTPPPPKVPPIAFELPQEDAAHFLQTPLLIDKEQAQLVDRSSQSDKAELHHIVELTQLFETQAQDPFLATFLTQAKDRLAQYTEKEKSNPLYRIKSLDALRAWKGGLVKNVVPQNDAAKKIKVQLLTLSAKLPKDEISALERSVELLSKTEENPGLLLLLQLYAKRDLSKLPLYNIGIRIQDIEPIQRAITHYLILSTYINHLTLTASLAQKVLDLPSPQDPEAGDIVREFFTAATQIRHFSLSEHPDYLAFEYTMKFLLRKEQIDNLEKLYVYRKK